jgi:hypothetical protein
MCTVNSADSREMRIVHTYPAHEALLRGDLAPLVVNSVGYHSNVDLSLWNALLIFMTYCVAFLEVIAVACLK